MPRSGIARGFVRDRPAGKMEESAERISENVFEAVLRVQFVYLPFDPVNYLAGFVPFEWRHFTRRRFWARCPARLFRAVRVPREHGPGNGWDRAISLGAARVGSRVRGDIAAYGTCKPRRDEKDEDGFAVASNRPFRTVDTLGRPRLAGQLGGLGEALTYQRLGTLRS